MEIDDTSLDLLWGADAIGKAIGVSRSRAFYLLEKGEIPAKKVGNRWVASHAALAIFFTFENKVMSGFLETLTEKQKQAALEYKGDDC